VHVALLGHLARDRVPKLQDRLGLEEVFPSGSPRQSGNARPEAPASGDGGEEGQERKGQGGRLGDRGDADRVLRRQTAPEGCKSVDGDRRSIGIYERGIKLERRGVERQPQVSARARARRDRHRGNSVIGAGDGVNAVFDAGLVNEGLLDFYNSTTNRIDGAFENRAAGTVKVRANAGSYDAQRNGTLTVASGFVNAGRLWLTNTAAGGNYYATTVQLVVTDGTLVNEATGVLDIDSPYVHNALVLAASIDNAGTINVKKSLVLNKAGAVFHNTGTLNVSAGITFTVTGGTVANLSGGTLTGGTYNVSGTWKFAGASIVTNAATIVLGAAAAKIVDSSNADALTALIQIAADGRLTLQGGRNLTLAHALANAGQVTIGSGTTLQVTGAYTQTDGVMALAGGTLNASGGVQIQGGVLVYRQF
jgi:hypothetical protein